MEERNTRAQVGTKRQDYDMYFITEAQVYGSW